LESKRIFILNQAQLLLNDLTLRSTTALQNLSSNLKNNNNNIDQIKSINSNKLVLQQQQQNQTIDENSIKAFKSIVNVCPSCQGDLFVV
jgi:hypothetical protein